VNIGALLIVLAGAAMVVATAGFYLSARGRTGAFSPARTAYGYATVLISLAGGLLFYYFLTGDFSYRYVYEYSSRSLSFFYLLSAFWAGQQGTYLLWLWLLAFLGYYLLRRGGKYTSWAMFFYGLINLFFLLILMLLSPFEKLATTPPDGAGLNPLLHDPWMVVHPPVIFLGYAAVALPFVLAMAALMRKEYDDFLPKALAPAALGAVALGAGNIMGGFWAYKTLGWGGYWAWDPVENSSFIPWMTTLALIHGFMVEKARGALKKTNLFMALFTFLLVIYGTFLTRSGVLAEFSVHSFVDLGINRYLVGFMIGFTVFSLGLFVLRSRAIAVSAADLKLTSRDFVLLVSVWLLSLIAIMVLAGTSWPLITTMFGKPGTVDTAMYTRVTFPLTVIIGLFLGFAPYMVWGGEGMRGLLRKAIPSALAAAIAALVGAFLGVRSFGDLAFVFAVSMALFSNLFVLIRYLPARIGSAGAQVAHFGFALMLLGILASSAYSSSQKLQIDQQAAAEVYGLNVTYKGMAGDITSPDNAIILAVNEDGKEFEARPKLFWSEQQQGLMKKPYIIRSLFYDLYLAPEQIIDLGDQNGIKLHKGETMPLGGYMITFRGFDQQAHTAAAKTRFGAILDVTDSTGKTETIIPSMIFEAGKPLDYQDVPLMAGLDTRMVRLEKIMADERAIQLTIAGLTPRTAPDQLIMEVSKKPAMNFLWAGAIIMLLGGLLALVHRWPLSRQSA
jgi:cytochrome c-type biogenesis protein CcmF